MSNPECRDANITASLRLKRTRSGSCSFQLRQTETKAASLRTACTGANREPSGVYQSLTDCFSRLLGIAMTGNNIKLCGLCAYVVQLKQQKMKNKQSNPNGSRGDPAFASGSRGHPPWINDDPWGDRPDLGIRRADRLLRRTSSQ